MMNAMPDFDGVARYIMVGGFLGAGKTTAIARFARHLTDRGLRVGLITNDQSTGLVDTVLLRSHGFAVEEITGGCFCCRFDSLAQAAGELSRQARPEVFLAEPVGSCTDLLATVSYPLRRMYGDQFRIAPLSVLVDPMRAARILELIEGRPFSDKVSYVYRKQLEEADLILINKCDELPQELREGLVDALSARFPRADVSCISAKEGDGLDAWFEGLLASEGQIRPTMELDYDAYAAGEACLGWLNATIVVASERPVDGNALLVRLAAELRERISAAGGEIAHLKMTLDSPGGQLAAVSVVSSDAEPDLRESLFDEVAGGTLILNLRAEFSPEELSVIVAEVLAEENRIGCGATLTCEHEEQFRPARPTPTHRLAVGETFMQGGTDRG
ncbi:MAG: GTP-binding protein [Planctomycetota bacterium]|jgi:G3E family GTPase|nr:GTP-binding protein [Planctomycetota bacterium]